MVFVAAVAMWVTAGCGRRAVDLMDRADALLDDRPDSAKVLLAQINPDRFLCPGRRARKSIPTAFCARAGGRGIRFWRQPEEKGRICFRGHL